MSRVQRFFYPGCHFLGVAGATLFSTPSFAQLASDLPRTGVDGLLAGLPGVLIAGLALVFAIRERGRARKLQAELDLFTGADAANESTVRTAQTDAAIGVWHLDKSGHTIFQSASVSSMLAGDTTSIVNFASAVQRKVDDFPAVTCERYQASLFPLDASPAREVSVIERLCADGSRMITIVDPTRIEDQVRGPAHSPVAA